MTGTMWKRAGPRGLFFAALLGLVTCQRPLAAELGPESDLCAAVNTLAPGEELVLRPGDYQGPCAIRRGGTARAPIVIRAADLAQRPRIVYAGDSDNVLEVHGSHVRIRGLAFGPTQWGVDAIVIFGGTDVTVDQCDFSGIGGIAVVANRGNVAHLGVLHNVIRNSNSTGMYFGCHDGIRCVVSGLRVEGNFVRGVQALDPEIGYGLEVKLNSSGIIRDNVIVDTKGPGIMVYGSSDLLTTSLVERNVVMGSLGSSGIVVAGGPVLVRNNIASGNAEAGIALEDYKRRGLLRGVLVVHNTVYKNLTGGIIVPSKNRVRDATLVNNAAQARAGTAAFPAGKPGVHQAGNIDCTWASCFVDPDRLDFSPVIGSLLSNPRPGGAEPWLPSDDYFGARRGAPPVAGAIERRAGPVTLGLKP